MAGNPLTDPTWAADVADSIERVVGTVRETVTNRVITVLHGAVFGIIIGMVTVAVVVVVLVAGTKLLQDLLQFAVRTHERAVWVSYLVMSALLFLGGAICMGKRFTADEEGAAA